MPTTAEWREAIRRRWPALWRSGIAVALIAGVITLWQVYNIEAYTEPAQWLALGQSLRAQPLAVPLIIALYVGAGIAFLPLTVMVVATIIVYGPGGGFAIASAGTVASASVSFLLGYVLGARPLQRLSGRLLTRLNDRARAHGVMVIAALRILPIAHFHAVSMLAGASRIRFPQYLMGTMLGTLPGIFIISILGNQAKSLVFDPNLPDILILTAIAAASVILLQVLRHYLQRFTRDLKSTPEKK